MNPGYDWFVEGDAYRYLVSLPKRRRRLLENSLERLASQPFQPPLYSEQSDESLRWDTIQADDHFITYHADHAVRRIWVAEIKRLS